MSVCIYEEHVVVLCIFCTHKHKIQTDRHKQRFETRHTDKAKERVTETYSDKERERENVDKRDNDGDNRRQEGIFYT